MLDELIKSRRKQFVKEIGKYLRLIFNDHFTLLLLFVLGAGGFLYRELLQVVDGKLLSIIIFINLLMVLVMSLGTIASYLEAADQLFMMPKSHQIKPIYKKAMSKLWGIKSLVLLLIALFFSPLMVVATSFEGIDLAFYIVHLIAWQGLTLYSQYQRNLHEVILPIDKIIYWLIIFSLGVLMMWFKPLIVFGISFVLAAVFFLLLKKEQSTHLAIEQLIAVEQQRKLNWYKLFSQVTDVPQLPEQPIKSSIYNKLIEKVFLQKGSRVDYLLPRIFFRQKAYVTLFIRLVIIGMLFIYFATNPYLIWLFAAVFQALILIQVVPIAKVITERPLTKIYPLSQQALISGLKKFLWCLAILIILFFAVVGLVNGIAVSGLLVALNMIVTLIMIVYYVPKSIKKLPL